MLKRNLWWIVSIFFLVTALVIYDYKSNGISKNLWDGNSPFKKSFNLRDTFLERIAKGSDELEIDYLLLVFLDMENCKRCSDKLESLSLLNRTYSRDKLNILAVAPPDKDKSITEMTLEWVNIEKKYGFRFPIVFNQTAFDRYSSLDITPQIMLFDLRNSEQRLVYQSIYSDNDSSSLDYTVIQSIINHQSLIINH